MIVAPTPATDATTGATYNNYVAAIGTHRKTATLDQVTTLDPGPEAVTSFLRAWPSADLTVQLYSSLPNSLHFTETLPQELFMIQKLIFPASWKSLALVPEKVEVT